eukprot:897250-Rhodomonas_salina.1
MSNTYKTAGAVILGIIVFTLAVVFLGMAEAKHDWAIAIMQILICVIGQGFILAYSEKTEAADITAFGIYMVSVAPSISFITSTFHAWLEVDMLYMSATVLTVFFVLTLVDDVLCVFWSKQSNGKAEIEIQEKHMHLHAFIFVTALFVIFLLATLNLPALHTSDPLNGTLLFSVVIVFALVFAIAPTMLYEVSAANTMQLMAYKEVAEMGLRLIFFV